jgi:secondary thiamine-phosphate synthase enzyme
MRQASQSLVLTTHHRGLVEITHRIQEWIRHEGFRDGLLTAFVRHTSASLLIQENADPGVQRDLEKFFARLAVDGDPLFEHDQEGDDDMPAHVRSALTQTHLSVPLAGGHLALGTWQGIYLWEHRRVGHRREVFLHLIGE